MYGILQICIAGILNITPDHLQRHGDMSRYIDAKLQIAKNTNCLVLNYDDEILKSLDLGELQIKYFSYERYL